MEGFIEFFGLVIFVYNIICIIGMLASRDYSDRFFENELLEMWHDDLTIVGRIITGILGIPSIIIYILALALLNFILIPIMKLLSFLLIKK